MRIKCPACTGKSRIFSVNPKESKQVDLLCDCCNPDCAARFVMTVDYLRHVRKMHQREKLKAPPSLLRQINALTLQQQQDLQAQIAWKTE